MYLHLDHDGVRHDLIESGTISFNEEYDPDETPFHFVDIFGASAFDRNSWTSSYSTTGVLGEAEKATPAKGKAAYEEAVRQLARFVAWFKDRPKDQRVDRHTRAPTMATPWGQSNASG